MNTYTHYFFAAQLAGLFRPEQPAEYYWGAVAPDVRYLAGLPRAQTHRPRADLLALHARFPQCRSFLKGYQVHCLLDEIDLPRLLRSAFPLNLLGRVERLRLSQHQAAILVELHYLQNPLPPLPLGGGHNAVLEELSISAEDARAFADGMRDYLAHPSIESGLRTFERLGFMRSGQGEKYIRAAQALAKSPLRRALLLWLVRSARLEQPVERHMRAALQDLASKGFVVD